MARKRFTAEQIINKLRQAEVETAKGKSIKVICGELGVSEHTYYVWRRDELRVF